MTIKRGSGIILHITSLPGEYGIGTFGKEAYNFCDFLKAAGQKYWQILPMGQTGYGDSPYQCFSAFAGNPYFINFDILNKDGILEKKDYQFKNFGSNKEYVDYGIIFNEKMKILRLAFNNFTKTLDSDFEKFKDKESKWLYNYSLFMALKYKYNFKCWQEWDDSVKVRKESVIKKLEYELKDEIEYWNFLQYEFFKQWDNLKKYANKKGIRIIGDIPIYVSSDSSDVWSNPNVFELNKKTLSQLRLAGCPPDSFSSDGQLWGNPTYDWNYLKKTNYEWFIDRIEKNLKLYDIIRLDHFKGFESYWSVPNGEKTARNGLWKKGPGIDLFKTIESRLGKIDIIVEDLGCLTKETLNLIKQTGFAGMKVLQYAFDGNTENIYLPHNYSKNCVAYVGTHDNDTIRGWIESRKNTNELNYAINYLNLNQREGYNWGFIRGIWSSIADISMTSMQDLLYLGNEARMNRPSTLGGNWCWRVTEDAFNEFLAKKIHGITEIYGRCD